MLGFCANKKKQPQSIDVPSSGVNTPACLHSYSHGAYLATWTGCPRTRGGPAWGIASHSGSRSLETRAKSGQTLTWFETRRPRSSSGRWISSLCTCWRVGVWVSECVRACNNNTEINFSSKCLLLLISTYFLRVASVFYAQSFGVLLLYSLYL